MALVNFENKELVMDGSFISVHLTKNYNGVGIAYFANADNNHIWTVIIRKEQLTCNWEKVLEFLTMERLSREVFHIRGVVKRVLAPIDNPEMRNVSFPNQELHLMNFELNVPTFEERTR